MGLGDPRTARPPGLELPTSAARIPQWPLGNRDGDPGDWSLFPLLLVGSVYSRSSPGLATSQPRWPAGHSLRGGSCVRTLLGQQGRARDGMGWVRLAGHRAASLSALLGFPGMALLFPPRAPLKLEPTREGALLPSLSSGPDLLRSCCPPLAGPPPCCALSGHNAGGSVLGKQDLPAPPCHRNGAKCSVVPQRK